MSGSFDAAIKFRWLSHPSQEAAVRKGSWWLTYYLGCSGKQTLVGKVGHGHSI